MPVDSLDQAPPIREYVMSPQRCPPADPIPFHRPWIGEEEEREVLETLRSGWLTTGPKTKMFERQFADYVGAEHAVGLNSCTAALHLALLAHGVGQGDEVITSPITFSATANVIEMVGAKPVFVDVKDDTLNLDPSLLESAISPQTRAVIPVHFAGHPCDMDAIDAIARRHNLVVIEDAAHAIESSWNQRKIGGTGNTTCFSFYPTKNITTGEGGMITTHNAALAARLRRLSLHGINADAWQRHGNGQYRHWETIEVGYKYNMFDLQAAIGIVQLGRIDQFHATRKKWTQLYDRAFDDLPAIRTLERHTSAKCAYHLYPIRIDSAATGLSRDKFMVHLQENGVGVGVHFRPLHMHPYYREKYRYRLGQLPVAEKAGEQLLSLPLYPSLKLKQVLFIASTVRSIATGSVEAIGTQGAQT